MRNDDHEGDVSMSDHVFDCIIIGAGPGGLQAAIYLGRYNRDVLLVDRTGGRTWHAQRISNVLTHMEISGRKIIEQGIQQARRYNVKIEQKRVIAVNKNGVFNVSTPDTVYSAHFVIVSSGVYDLLPPIKNVYRFLGAGYFTCIDCDGYEMTGKKVVIMGNHLETVNLAIAMKQMYTRDITLIPYRFTLPESATEVLSEESIGVVTAEPISILGEEHIEGLALNNGDRVSCQAIMASFGMKLNDEFLAGLTLKKDATGFKYVVKNNYESSLQGLYIVGPLNTGNDQVIIAAGEGAVSAIDVNKRLLEEQQINTGEPTGAVRN